MAITFVPSAGMVLWCHYEGQEPEMTKDRRVIVISTKAANRRQTCMVVPFSTVEPVPPMGWHHEVPAGLYSFLPARCWAKADMAGVVAWRRLDRVKVDGKWATPKVSLDDLRAIQRAVMFAMGIEIENAKAYVDAVTP